LNKETINKIIDLTDKKIDEASNNILNSKFDINPKIIGDNNVSCEFCKYKDLCYKTEDDYIYLKEYKNLEFLKEENL
jgi:ATP-dependent helicase/DNAse subunit B